MDNLVRRLRSGNIALQIQALNTLEAVCKGSPVTSRAAASAGAIPVLVRLLRSSPSVIQATAVVSLTTLLESASELPAAVLAAGALPLLVALMRSSTLDSRQLALACIEAGALPHLAELAQASDTESRRNAAGALFSLASHYPAEVAAAPGVIPALVHVAGSNVDTGTLIHVVQGIRGLAAGSPQRSQAIVDAGGGAALLLLQSHADSGTREYAAMVLTEVRATAELRAAADVRAPADVAAGSPSRKPGRRVCAAEGCVATSGLKLCARCGTVRYCSPDCQRAHWPSHRDACKPA
ncbi:hypothetical protein ABPG77_010078 [Micractinium sp. CCAP 211/92]